MRRRHRRAARQAAPVLARTESTAFAPNSRQLSLPSRQINEPWCRTRQPTITPSLQRRWCPRLLGRRKPRSHSTPQRVEQRAVAVAGEWWDGKACPTRRSLLAEQRSQVVAGVVLEQFATAPVDRDAGRGARRRDATVARGDGHDPRSLGTKTAVAHEYEAGGLDHAEDSSAQHAGVVRGVPRVDAAGALHGGRRVPVRDLGWRATRRPRFGRRAARAQGRSPDEWLRDRCQRQRAVRYACPPVDCSPCPIPAAASPRRTPGPRRRYSGVRTGWSRRSRHRLASRLVGSDRSRLVGNRVVREWFEDDLPTDRTDLARLRA